MKPVEKMKYNVYELIGENGLTVSDGYKIYNLILPKLLQNENVELDFSNVKICIASFFSTAIGQLLKDISSHKLNELLIISNLNSTSTQLLNNVIKYSKLFYGEK